jgi:hypothetical protein
MAARAHTEMAEKNFMVGFRKMIDLKQSKACSFLFSGSEKL